MTPHRTASDPLSTKHNCALTNVKLSLLDLSASIAVMLMLIIHARSVYNQITVSRTVVPARQRKEHPDIWRQS